MADHPFSQLKNLVDKRAYYHLVYIDQGEVEGAWKARVSVKTGSDAGSPELAAEACALKKSQAKKLAAGVVMQKINEPLISLSDTDSGYSSDGTVDVVDIEPKITKKQKRVLEQAGAHLKALKESALGGRIILSIDLEVAISTSGDEVLEVGIAWAHPSQPCTSERCHHLVVEENAHLHNAGRYNQVDNFLFGRSERVKKEDVTGRIHRIMQPLLAQANNVCLVGHTIGNDLKWLRNVNVDVGEMLAGVEICDIGQAYQAMRGETQLTGLGRMMAAYYLPNQNAHNAGNDAYYGVQVCRKMMETFEAVQCSAMANDGAAG